MSMRTTLGLLAGATLLAVPAVAFAHPSPGMGAWGQVKGVGGVATLTAVGGARAAHSPSEVGAPMEQVDGVLSAPVTVSATASTTSAVQSSSIFSGSEAGLAAMVGENLVRPLLTITTVSSVQSAESLTLESGMSYPLAANAKVTYQGQAYAGTMLFPGERVHFTLSSGAVASIQLQSTSAWETYDGMSGGSAQLSYASGTMFTAPLAASAVVRTGSGTTTALSTLATGTLVRVVFNAQGQVMLLQETGRTRTVPVGQASTSVSGRANAHSQASSKGQGAGNASPEGQSAGSTHSQASTHAQGATHANAHAKGHGGLALGLSGSVSTNVGVNLGSS